MVMSIMIVAMVMIFRMRAGVDIPCNREGRSRMIVLVGVIMVVVVMIVRMIVVVAILMRMFVVVLMRVIMAVVVMIVLMAVVVMIVLMVIIRVAGMIFFRHLISPSLGKAT
jgi:hypothetical protein